MRDSECGKKGCENRSVIELQARVEDDEIIIVTFCKSHILTASDLLEALAQSMMEYGTETDGR